MNDAEKIERLRDALRRLLRHKNEMGGGCSLSDDIRIAEQTMADTSQSHRGRDIDLCTPTTAK